MTNERHDDETLGRALARAIETQDANETPYERSRIASRSARRGFPLWQLGGVAAALVLALAFGSWFTRPTGAGPVAASGTPTAAATGRASTSAPASSLPGGNDQLRVFFVRDALPPVSAVVRGSISGTSADAHVGSRVTAAHDADPASVPAGAANPLSLVGRGASSGGYGISVRVSGDTANVEFDLPQGWNVRGAAQAQALVQQLVYVITEEPGVRKARITEKGKTNAVIDSLIVDKPLSREDVLGYSFVPTTGFTNGITDAGSGDNVVRSVRIESTVDVVTPGLARVTVRAFSADGKPAKLPRWGVWLDAADPSSAGKYVLRAQLRAAIALFGSGTVEVVDRTPLRTITTRSDTIELALDDARPWRASVNRDESVLTVDIGGAPQAVSDRIAVYAPTPSQTIDSRISRTFTLSGAARVFEANVVWRLKDSTGRIVANGHTTASLGTSPVWGTVSTEVTLPSSVNGNATLEVYEASAKDGSELGLVAIPLAIR